MSSERIVAVGLLTQHDLDVLGPTFTQAFPVDGTPRFRQLLHAIDQADRGRSKERKEPSE